MNTESLNITPSLSEALTGHNYLNTLGSVSSLAFSLDPYILKGELKEFDAHWRQYNSARPQNRREGLAVTSMDGTLDAKVNLESLRDYNQANGTQFRELDFIQPTAVWRKGKSLHPLLECFPQVARTHILRVHAGGYFPPHRDLDPLAFRIIMPLWNCEPEQYVFLLEDRPLRLTPGRAYYVNTRLVHSLFSFTDECALLVMNIPCTKENCLRLTQRLLPT